MLTVALDDYYKKTTEKERMEVLRNLFNTINILKFDPDFVPEDPRNRRQISQLYMQQPARATHRRLSFKLNLQILAISA